MPLRALSPLAIADFIQWRQVAANVVCEAPGQVVHPHFFRQPVRGIVGKAVGRVVLVHQRRQANGLVVLVANALPFCVLPTARQPARRAQQTRGLTLAVAVAEHLTVDVVGEALRNAIRVMDAQYLTVGLAAWWSGSTHR